MLNEDFIALRYRVTCSFRKEAPLTLGLAISTTHTPMPPRSLLPFSVLPMNQRTTLYKFDRKPDKIRAEIINCDDENLHTTVCTKCYIQTRVVTNVLQKLSRVVTRYECKTCVERVEDAAWQSRRDSFRSVDALIA